MAKRKIATAKTKNHTKQPNITQLEKSFLKMPTQILAQLNKEIASLKNTEKTLKQKMIKIKQATSKNISPAKAMKTAKIIQTLTKELKIVAKSMQIARDQQTKLIALKKLLAHFRKNWTNQAQAIAKPATMKKTKSRNKKTSKKSAQPSIDSSRPSYIAESRDVLSEQNQTEDNENELEEETIA
ncbi:MAG: hypothetical protein A3F43_02455 [Gammaproteobacteria bacterium RIFCSPHIGHO2_12_FULL_42_10]|nr:MAG: hypothetical protein A3F43_02455 [Gammaproteobacteria bacterium RIFCSPHIGHO2_12_FULL_42_10]